MLPSWEAVPILGGTFPHPQPAGRPEVDKEEVGLGNTTYSRKTKCPSAAAFKSWDRHQIEMVQIATTYPWSNNHVIQHLYDLVGGPQAGSQLLAAPPIVSGSTNLAG